MPLHSETFATHSCFLAQGEKLLFACEDIGRHNALDKAIGYALRHDIDLKTCIAYSSGRIPTDMVEKVIRAGIPVFASKASPTQEAIALANAYGVTLICGARSDRMKQYTP
jgi:FdhD protein